MTYKHRTLHLLRENNVVIRPKVVICGAIKIIYTLTCSCSSNCFLCIRTILCFQGKH